MTEHEAKRRRARGLLDDLGLDEIVLRDPANLAWYLCGARVHVVQLADDAILEVTVRRDGEALRASAIEAPRLAAEELGPDRGSDRPRGAHRRRAGPLPSALPRHRGSRWRGAARRDAAGLELALAGRAAHGLCDRGVEPLVLLVAGGERLPLHRHPLPTG